MDVYSEENFNPLTPRGVRRDNGQGIHQLLDNFNPLTPRGVRPMVRLIKQKRRRFQSTHPSRGETFPIKAGFLPLDDFNPLTPRGVRLSSDSGCLAWSNFNPLTPRGVRRGLENVLPDK